MFRVLLRETVVIFLLSGLVFSQDATDSGTPDQQDLPSETQSASSDSLTGCGLRNPDGIQNSIKSDNVGDSLFGEFNWIVAVLSAESVFQCGGSLIHPQIVLTAAHCVHALIKGDQTPNLKVRAGEWDSQTTSEILPYQEREVTKIVENPDYVGGVLFNDAALLFLKSPLEMAANVGTICLPETDAEIISDTRCFTTEWGKNSFGKEGLPKVILKKTELPLVTNSDCQKALRTGRRLGSQFILNRSFLCAGGEEGKDSCVGDGGAPLVCPIQYAKNRYKQMGIVSWNNGCGEKQIPGVYGYVSLFRQWIDETVVGEGFQIDSYKY